MVAKTPYHRSVSVRFFLLILAVAVPLAGFDYYHASKEIDLLTEGVSDDLQVSNRNIVGKFHDLIGASEDLLKSLAVAKEVRGGDLEACSTFLHDIGRQFDKYTNFSVVDANRFIVCSSGALPKPVDVSASPNINAAFANKAFAISPFKFGVLTGKPTLVFSQPLFNADGDVTGTVNNGLNLTWLNDYLASIAVHPEEKILIFDGKGVVLATHPEQDMPKIGSSIADTPFEDIVLPDGDAALVKIVDVRGYDTMIAVQPISQIPGRAYVASYLSLDTALANTISGLYQRLIALALISVAVLLVGWLGARLMLLDPIDKLIAMTGRLEDGDFTVRSGVPHGEGEIGRLASAFDRMVEGLSNRTQALQESEANYRELVESGEQLVHRYLPDGTELIVNNAMARFFGGTPAEWVGQKWIERVSQEQRGHLRRMLKACTQDNPVFIYEQMSRNAHGENRWLRWSNHAFFDESGKIKYFQSVGIDLTERKQAESALESAMMEARAASKAKSDFLANMSHELRTPLNAIIGFSEMMSAEMMGALPDTYKEYAGLISSSGKHLLDLISDILDLSKIEAGMMKLDESRFHLSECIQDVAHLIRGVAEKNGNKLVLRYGVPADKMLFADKLRIKQVLLNIIGNAVKFTSDGTVTVEVSMEGDGQVVTITDTGIGMSDKDIKTALSPFGQVDSDHLSKRFEGTGLGLPLALQLMGMHGGELAVQSRVGEGTVVTLRFPAERTAA